MEDIREAILGLKTCIKEELNGVKRLSGTKYKHFIELFNLDDNPVIYYTEYNLIVLDTETYQRLAMLCGKDHIVIKIESPPYNSTIYVFNYYNAPVFEGLL